MDPQDPKLANPEKRIRELDEKVAQQPNAEQFTEDSGALFKRNSNGEYLESVFCPRCRFAASRHNDSTYICLPCRHVIVLSRSNVREVILNL
jgi:hypothetical protein